MTIIELMVASTILLLALLSFTKVIVFSTGTTEVQHDVMMAREATRQAIETIQSAEFSDIFALYNSDPTDDPEGYGTGPGDGISVDGLTPPSGTTATTVGQIVFPAIFDDAGDLQIREDYVDAALGMPRDLNGDGVIDSEDHSDDYQLLPVRVLVEWEGKSGTARLEVRTLLADY
jgi:type II secretory pathway pseudopilin PulG